MTLESDAPFVPAGRLLAEERLLVAALVERRLLSKQGLPNPDRLPLRRSQGAVELALGAAIGFTAALFALLFVFVLANMLLHVSF